MTILHVPVTASSQIEWNRRSAYAINQIIVEFQNYQPLADNLTSLAALDLTGNTGYAIVVNGAEDGFELVAGGGGGGTTTNALTINNSGSGAASGATFNGASAITISYNTIGAQPAGSYLTGNQTITLSGDVTGSGATAITTTIANGAVTYAKMQDVSAASRLIGRGSASGSGDPEEITLGSGLSMSGTTLSATGGAWALAGSGQTATGVYDFAVDGAKANIDFTGLGSFNEIMIFCRGLSWSVSGVRLVHVSVNNGSTFYSASGDYVTIDNAGVEANTTTICTHSTATTAARSMFSHILNTKGVAKMGMAFTNTSYPPTLRIMFVASASDINAIRVTSSGGGNCGAGTVRVYAR